MLSNINTTFRIAIWNANGLMQHIPEIEIFLNTEKIDIFLISESHFVKSSFAKIRAYNLYHSIHPAERARGGSALLIKENIKHHVESKIEEETMQVTTVRVHIKHRQLTVSAIYCPPRHNLKREDYIKLFKSLGRDFIIGGDFNAKNTYWGSRLTTSKGRELFAAGLTSKCEFYSGGSPTYWPSDEAKIPDLIDFYVTRGISQNYIHIENCESLASDHSPVIMTISETIIKRERAPRLTNFKTNWDLFRELMEEKINLQVPIRNHRQLEDELDKLNEIIHYAAMVSTPSIQNNEKPNITYPMEVRELVSKK